MVEDTTTPTERPSARKMRERLRRLGWLTEAQAALGWGIILVLAALLGAIYLIQASRIATVGRRVQFLQNDLDALHRDNAGLERQIAEAQSLTRLQQEALRLGFIPANPEEIEYITVADYPVPQPTPTPVSIPAIPPETIGQAIWLVVRERITGLTRAEAGD